LAGVTKKRATPATVGNWLRCVARLTRGANFAGSG
jgi:hypothetical protein